MIHMAAMTVATTKTHKETDRRIVPVRFFGVLSVSLVVVFTVGVSTVEAVDTLVPHNSQKMVSGRRELPHFSQISVAFDAFMLFCLDCMVNPALSGYLFRERCQ